MTLFNPSNQERYCKHVERCIMGSAPTMEAIGTTYGEETAQSWLHIQLTDLAEFAGCKDKLTERQKENIAGVILTQFPYLKATEIMLFFLQFKSGRYGKFYGAVDGLVITEALQRFMKERRDKIAEYETKKKRDAIEAQKNDPRNINRFQWEAMKQRYEREKKQYQQQINKNNK